MHDAVDAETDLAGLAAWFQMDIRCALFERVLQQPVDDMHYVAIVRAHLARLAQLHQLLEVEQGGRVVAIALGVLRHLDRALYAVELLQVSVDVQRAGHHPLHVAPQHLRQVAGPCRIERFAGGERHRIRGGGDRKDAVPLRIRVADHLGDRAGVDLHRIDFQVRQVGFRRQPFGQRFQAERPPGIALVGQLGVGHEHQWMQFHRGAPGADAHAHPFRVVAQQKTVHHQRGQQIVQLQSAAAAEQRRDWR